MGKARTRFLDQHTFKTKPKTQDDLLFVKKNIVDLATQVVLIGGSLHSRGKGSLQKW